MITITKKVSRSAAAADEDRLMLEAEKEVRGWRRISCLFQTGVTREKVKEEMVYLLSRNLPMYSFLLSGYPGRCSCQTGIPSRVPGGQKDRALASNEKKGCLCPLGMRINRDETLTFIRKCL
jgi:hypothetical protein